MLLSPGAKLGPYEILGEPIGRGGMGEVYKAHDPRLRRDVAIKVSAARFNERFEREARAVAALNHPNICQIYDVGPNYLVMELIEGPTLAQRIREGAIPLDEALTIAKQIGAALEAAHEKQITHRDLKPGNVKLRPDGVVKVLDFGLAKVGQAAPPESIGEDSPTLTMAMTEAGMILGTAAYMAPEQVKGKQVDKRADIWAFGVVLHEMVTGKRLFQGEDMVEILAAVVHAQPDLTAVPLRVRRLIAKCLEKDPNKRLRDMSGMEFLLAEEAPAPVVTTPASPPARHIIWPWAAATVLAVAALSAVSYLHFREVPPEVVKLEFAPPEKSILNQRTGAPAVSPDGKRVVFRADTEGGSMLWVRDLNSLTARVLPGTATAGFPFWAPDSRQIAFFSGGKMQKIDVAGGPALTIANTNGAAMGGSWNQDDTIIIGTSTGLKRVPAAGGTLSDLTTLDSSRQEGGHRNPHFLPDGRHYLYLGASQNSEKSAIFVGDLNSKDKKLLVSAESNAYYVEPGYILFVREQTLMAQPFDAGKLATTGDAVPIAEQVDYNSNLRQGYFGASRNGLLVYASGGDGGNAQQITWYDRSGKAVGTVGKPVDVQTPRLSPDGKMIAVDRMDPQTRNRDIVLYDLMRGTQQRLTFANNNTEPVWSPDGKRIAYFRRNDAKVAAKSADGTGNEEILEDADKRPMDWTRDGGFLLLATGNGNPKTGTDIWGLSLTGDRKPFPIKVNEFSDWGARISPDGHWLAYDSDQSKRKEVYVVPFPNSASGSWQVSVDGGRYPVWSRDGRELYFASQNSGGKLMAVDIRPGPQFQAGIPKPLFDVRLGSNNPSYDVSADGRFLFATPTESSATVPMTVVLNWPSLFKK